MATRVAAFPVAALLVLAAAAPAQNCANTSVGSTPLTELAGSYQGFAGGLYGNGANVPPVAHAQAGLAQAAAVQPLDAAGNPSPGGSIVLLSIGMSNTTQEFAQFVALSNADPNRSGAVVVVDGAQGGQDALAIANPNAQFWTVVQQRLQNAGVTAQQVQAVWLKEAIAGVTGGFPGGALTLRDRLGDIARNLQAFYPNVKLCFVSSRIYAGYATTSLNPEPYAYESGFAVQWLLGQQIAGDPALNFDPARGAVTSPWLGWGPYLWADGLVPRLDGLVWQCQDFQADGTHPSTSGRAKVAAMLNAFFTQSPFATPWYLGPNDRAMFVVYGDGCGGTNGTPRIRNNGMPVLGNAAFRVGVSDARAGAASALFLAAAAASVPLTGACTVLIDPLQPLPSFFAVTGPAGAAQFAMPVPNVPSLVGADVFVQWFVDDPAGAPLPPLAGVAATPGARIRVGAR